MRITIINNISILAMVAALPTAAFAAEAPEDPDVRTIIVIGEADGYKADSSNTATKTDTPLIDVPQSVTVVTRERLDDQAMASMGDDTPMAVLSVKNRSLYDYFRQQFALVTNPPIDPLREAVVMSLESCIGPEQQSIFEESESHASRVILTSPVLSTEKFRALVHLDRWGYRLSRLPLHYDPAVQNLRGALTHLCHQAAEAVRAGHVLILLTDQDCTPPLLPIHALLATGAVHHHLSREGLRCNANILVATATARALLANSIP